MISQQLLDYVRQQVAAGVSKEDLTKKLVTNGWGVPDIDAALNVADMSTTSPHTQMPFSQQSSTISNSLPGKKKVIQVFIGVLIVFVIGVASLAYLNFISPSTFAQLQSQASTTTAASNAEGAGSWASYHVLIPSVANGWAGIASSADGTHLAVDGAYGSDDPYAGDIFTSSDSGVTWTAHHANNDKYGNSWSDIVTSADGTHLAAIESGYVFTSTDSGVTWTAHDVTKKVDLASIASSADGTRLAAIGSAAGDGYVYTSKNAGVTWTAHIIPGASLISRITSSADGTFLAVAAYASMNNYTGGYIYTSSDSGATWTVQTGAGQHFWSGIASSADGTRLAAISSGDYIYTSSDSGATWTAQTGAGKTIWNNIASSADGTRLAATVREESDVWIGAPNITTPPPASTPKPLQNQTQTNQPNGPTMTVNQTTATYGDTFIFTLHKNSQNAASWKFRLSCSAVLDGEWNGSCDQRDTYYPDSPNTLTLPIPVFGEVLQNQTATAVFEAYDKSGNSLGQSNTISLTIEPNNSFLDRMIQVDVLNTYTGADLLDVNNELAHNTNGYLGTCTDTNVAPLIKQLKSISNSVVCKDSTTAYAVSAQMKSNPSQYFCMYGPQTASTPADDINGVIRSSAITTTSCR